MKGSSQAFPTTNCVRLCTKGASLDVAMFQLMGSVSSVVSIGALLRGDFFGSAGLSRFGVDCVIDYLSFFDDLELAFGVTEEAGRSGTNLVRGDDVRPPPLG